MATVITFYFITKVRSSSPNSKHVIQSFSEVQLCGLKDSGKELLTPDAQHYDQALIMQTVCIKKDRIRGGSKSGTLGTPSTHHGRPYCLLKHCHTWGRHGSAIVAASVRDVAITREGVQFLSCFLALGINLTTMPMLRTLSLGFKPLLNTRCVVSVTH